MSVLLRMYDNITSSPNISLGLTAASLAGNAYSFYSTGMGILSVGSFYCAAANTALPVTIIAGSVIAILTRLCLSNSESIKSNAERTTIYSTLAIASGIPRTYKQTVLNPIADKVAEWAAIFFGRAFLGMKTIEVARGFQEGTIPIFWHGFNFGFLATNLIFQLKDKISQIGLDTHNNTSKAKPIVPIKVQ